ncbi:MAG: hypothetical protein ABIN61_06105 [candidate division WOR-3 bacterium]
MKKMIIFSFLLILFFGCKKVKDNKFTPPENGIVTEEMAKRYVRVSIALTKIAEEEAVKLAELRKKYNISQGMSELSDSEYVKKNPEVAMAWKSLQEDWERKKDSVYKAMGMSEEEWDWIAGAIITRENKPIREFISKEFDRLMKEESSSEKK